MFRSLGYEIVFLLYAFEDRWYWRSQIHDVESMRAQWDDVRVIHARRQVAMPPRTGKHHRLDEWWDELLEDYLVRLLEYENFDIVVVHNVWLSKAFDFVPERIAKILDSHDIFFPRVGLSETLGVKNDFLRITSEEEMTGLSRAHIVLTIKGEETALLASADVRSKVLDIPYVSDMDHCIPTAGRSYKHPGKVRFGFLGSAHSYNIAGLKDLMVELDRVVRTTYAPLEIIIAGDVCRAIGRFATSFKPEMIGYVESENAFYESVDIAVVPVFIGTGFKIKVADLIAFGMPLLCATHAAEGTALDSRLLFATAQSLAEKMGEIAFHRPPLAAMAALARSAAEDQKQRFEAAKTRLNSEIADSRRVIVAAVSGRTLDATAMIRLVAIIMHARTVRQSHFFEVTIDERLHLDLEALNATAPPGLSFVGSRMDRKADDRFPSAGQIILCGEEVVTSTIVGSLPSTAIVLCDLRFLELGGHSTSPLRFPELTHFLVNHRQSHLVEPGYHERDFYCTPLLGGDVSWDPSVKLIFDAWLARRDAATEDTFKGTVLVCSSSVDAKLYSKSLSIAYPDAVMVVDCGISQDLERLIAWGLRVARGLRPEAVQIVDSLRGQSWVGAFLDEIVAFSGEQISVIPFRKFLASKHCNELQRGTPKYRPAERSIFWDISKRVSTLRTLPKPTSGISRQPEAGIPRE